MFCIAPAPFGSVIKKGKLVDNECTCTDGTPGVGLDCWEDGTEQCTACKDEFFHIEVRKEPRTISEETKTVEVNYCKINKCHCNLASGEAAVGGPYCPVDGGESCSACPEGMWALNKDDSDGTYKCGRNRCRCKRSGRPVGLKDCPDMDGIKNGGYKCASCNKGVVREWGLLLTFVAGRAWKITFNSQESRCSTESWRTSTT